MQNKKEERKHSNYELNRKYKKKKHVWFESWKSNIMMH